MKRAFTLIELLVVIAIIGLLSSIVLASLTSARSKANDSKRVTDLREVQKALEGYANDNGGSYPNTGGSWRSECSAAGSYAPQNVASGLVPAYISQFPTDPQMNATAGTCCYYYVSDKIDYDLMDFNCSTANTSNAALAPLKDPVYTSAWSVHTAGAAAKGW
jgi:type II secretion system protein G